MLNNAADAHKLINKELSSVSEVVARAVRLRIRLAAGVKLVDVIGSYRLDEVGADRVRQAEQSIDRRLSRNLGIISDRGDDEAGIQIVIPAFYADTSHVVMLDVVASGPGPVADVTVRYKDLVQLKNGVARANLSLDRTEHVAGPLERNVTKNLLAFHLAQSLGEASKLLKAGQPQQCEVLIREQLALLESFRNSVPGFDVFEPSSSSPALYQKHEVAIRKKKRSSGTNKFHQQETLENTFQNSQKGSIPFIVSVRNLVRIGQGI